MVPPGASDEQGGRAAWVYLRAALLLALLRTGLAARVGVDRQPRVDLLGERERLA